MSVQQISWAYKQTGISTGAKFLLVTLANYANHAGVSWPGQERLGRDLSATPRSIINWAQELEKKGIIAVERRQGDGTGRKTNVYTLINRQSENYSHCGGQSENYDRQSEPFSPNTKEEPSVKEKINKKEKWKLPGQINIHTWDEFEQHRKEIRKPMTDRARKKNADVLVGLTREQQQASVDATIANRWTGLFPPKVNGHENRKGINQYPESPSARASRIFRERYGDSEEAIPVDEGAVRRDIHGEPGRQGHNGHLDAILDGEYTRETH